MRREKSPNWGLIWREKLGLGFEKRLKWAEIMRGELCGEPKRPTPDLREREKGVVAEVAALLVAEEVVVVELGV